MYTQITCLNFNESQNNNNNNIDSENDKKNGYHFISHNKLGVTFTKTC